MSMTSRELAAVRVAKALADPTRFRLLRELASRDEVSCQELTDLTDVAQPTVSHHLKVLADAGLASPRKEGSFHYYRAHREAIAAHLDTLGAAFGPPAPRRRAAGRVR
jgi:DNA-binding transcriptional ArsR family regulator